MRAASTTYLRANDVVTPNDLLNLLLIGSDNAAARALARISPFGTEGFIEKMNGKAPSSAWSTPTTSIRPACSR